MNSMEDGKIIAECEHCHERKETFADSKMCEDCESYYTYCIICNDWQDTSFNQACRHLMWSDYYGMDCGSGAAEGYDVGRAQLHALLDVMGLKFAEILVNGIATEQFYFQFHGSLLGTDGVNMNLCDRRSYSGFGATEKLEQAMKDANWDTDSNAQLAIEGVYWLVSLWAKKEDKHFYTGEANKLTVQWIKEWAEQQGEPN